MAIILSFFLDKDARRKVIQDHSNDLWTKRLFNIW